MQDEFVAAAFIVLYAEFVEAVFDGGRYATILVDLPASIYHEITERNVWCSLVAAHDVLALLKVSVSGRHFHDNGEGGWDGECCRPPREGRMLYRLYMGLTHTRISTWEQNDTVLSAAGVIAKSKTIPALDIPTLTCDCGQVFCIVGDYSEHKRRCTHLCCPHFECRSVLWPSRARLVQHLDDHARGYEKCEVPMCVSMFARGANRTEHMIEHEQYWAMQRGGMQKCAVPGCEFQYLTANELWVHYQTPAISCAYCNFKCVHKQDLRDHHQTCIHTHQPTVSTTLLPKHVALRLAECAVLKKEECPIDLAPFSSFDELLVTPCGHVCSRAAAHLTKCPMCQQTLPQTVASHSIVIYTRDLKQNES